MEEKKRLHRSSDDTWVAGILGGLGEHFNVDPSIIRIVFILLTVFSVGVPTILIYLIMWMLVPQK